MKRVILIALTAIVCMAAKAQTYYATVTPSVVGADNKGVMWFNLINEGIEFTACQMDVKLPEGFKFAYTTGRGGKISYDKPVFSEDRTDDVTGHTFDSYDVSEEGRAMKVIAHSASNQNFYDTDIDDQRAIGLIRFGYVATAGLEPGLYEGEVTNIIFADEAAVAYTLPDVRFTIMVQGDGSTVTLNVSAAGVATLMLPFTAELPNGLQAWVCESVDGEGWVHMKGQEEIPANTPLVITGTPGKYTFTGTPEGDELQYTAGVLTGTYELLNIKEGYALQSHSGKAAFYNIDAVDGENILPYRCYIPAQMAAKMSAYHFLWNGATGIGTLPQDGNQSCYDLSGRRTKVEAGQGVKIINNKKILKR